MGSAAEDAPADSDLLTRIRVEYKVACRHLGPKAYAELLGVTVPRLKQLVKETGTTQVVAWSRISDEVLRGVFDAFVTGNEVAARFAARHGYSVGGLTKALQSRWPDEWELTCGEKRPEYANLYKMGRSFERRVRLQLLAAGYFVVRSAGSKTKVDLTAIKDGEILLIQCKRSGALPPDEWNGLLDVAAQTGGIPVLVENPYAGCTNWWQVLTRKEGRGTGVKVPFLQPEMILELDFDAVDRELDDADSDALNGTALDR